jgi:hypothetical protein
MQAMLWDFLEDSGVSLMTETVISGVYIEDGRVVGARLFGKGKEINVRSQMLIDSSSDGHVIRMCPVVTYFGRDTDGKTVPFTVRCSVRSGEGRYSNNNGDSGYCNQYDAVEFSKKIINARASRKYYDKSKQRLVAMAPVCGVREGIRFEGEEKLRYGDVFLGIPPKKTLFYAYSDIDKHGHDLACDEELYQNWWVISNLATVTVRIAVPFGAVVPKGLRGIVSAGRCFSVDSYSLSAVRMNRDMFRMGECVGIAAAMAVKSNCDFLDIDYSEFVSKAEAYGCYAGEREKAFGFDSHQGAFPYRPLNFQMSVDEIVNILDTEHPGPAIWASYRYGGDELAKRLAELLDSDSELLRYNSAIALGIMGRKEGLELLRRLVRERNGFFFKDCRRSNQFRSAIAICLLGRLGEKEDIDLLYPIVFDNAEFDREIYRTFKGDTLTSALECCNFLLFQLYTHAAAAIYKLSKAHGVNLREAFETRFGGKERELVISRITSEDENGAVYGEISDFMDYILRLMAK